jgi:hypothetical protein
MAEIRQLPSGWEGIAEKLRFTIERSVGKPHNDKVWGSLTRAAKAKSILIDTGRTAPMRDPRSNGRKSTVWRRV